MRERKATTSRMRLSEANLRIHNTVYPQDKSYQVELIQADRRRSEEDCTPQRMFSEAAWAKGVHCDVQDQDEAWKAASLDALRLYHGFPLIEPPMNDSRWICEDDRNLWLTMAFRSVAGFPAGDVEARDLRRVASEIASWEDVSNNTSEGSVGSLQASSDTLSVSRYREVKSPKKGTGKRKRAGLRRGEQ